MEQEEYDAAVLRTPELCPLLLAGDRRSGRQALPLPPLCSPCPATNITTTIQPQPPCPATTTTTAQYVHSQPPASALKI